MFLERENRLAFEKEEVVDLLMEAAREKFGDKIPTDAHVALRFDIDDDSGDELFKLTWE